MADIFLIIVAVVLLVIAGLFIPVILEFRRTMLRFNRFINNTDESLSPALNELQKTLENVNSLAGDIKYVTAATKGVSESLQDTAANIKAISMTISGLRAETNATVAGLKAGLKAAFGVFIKNIIQKGG